MNSGRNLFNPISELVFLGHLGSYRTAAPTYCRITTDAEIFRDLGQRPVATLPDQIHRHFARLVLSTSHPAHYYLPRHFVLPHHFADDALRFRLYRSPLIACMLPRNCHEWLSYALHELFAALDRSLTLP